MFTYNVNLRHKTTFLIPQVGYGYHKETKCHSEPKKSCHDVPKKIPSSHPKKKCNSKPKKRCHEVPEQVYPAPAPALRWPGAQGGVLPRASPGVLKRPHQAACLRASQEVLGG